VGEKGKVEQTELQAAVLKVLSPRFKIEGQHAQTALSQAGVKSAIAKGALVLPVKAMRGVVETRKVKKHTESRQRIRLERSPGSELAREVCKE